MASKRRLRRECRRKRSFESLGLASRAAAIMRRAHPGEAFGGYRCPLCRAYHVGHTPRAALGGLVTSKGRAA